MLSRRALVLMILLISMEMTAGFGVIVGSSLLDAISAQYAMFWLLLVSALAGMIVSLLLSRNGPGEPWNRILLLLGAAIGAGIPAVGASHNSVSFVVALFLLVIAFSRGVAVAEEMPTHDQILRRFGIGFGLLFIGLIWVVARGIDSHRGIWEMLAFVGVGYTVLAMIALVIARVERAREPGSGQAIMLAVGAQLIVIVLIALGALQIFAYDLVGGVMGHTQPFWNALGATLYRFVTLLAGPIQWFIDLLRPHGHPQTTRPNGPGPLATPEQFGRKPKQPPKSSPVAVIAALVVIGLILAGVLYAIWRALPRISRKRPDRGFTEERRSLSLGQMLELLASWLRRIFSRGTQAATDVVLAGRRRVLGDLPADPVRRAYVQMLRRAAAAGLRRETDTTPGELRLRLAAAWPDGAGDFSGLTAAYMRRRYGEIVADEQEVARVREQWQRLRMVMRQPRMGVAIAAAAGTARAGESTAPVRKRRRWRLPRPRIHFPEAPFGEQTPKFSRSAVVAVVSFVAPILIIIGLLAVLAIISNTAVKHHGLGRSSGTYAGLVEPVPMHSHADGFFLTLHSHGQAGEVVVLPAFSGIMNGIQESR